MKKNVLGIIIFLLLIAAIGWWAFTNSKPKQAQGTYDGFAQCLESKGVTMYGAAWCSHCQEEKRILGESFRFVPYVECPDNPTACSEKNIQSYPTWLLPNGERLVGEQNGDGYKQLSEKAGCPVDAAPRQ